MINFLEVTSKGNEHSGLRLVLAPLNIRSRFNPLDKVCEMVAFWSWAEVLMVDSPLLSILRRT